MSLEFKTVYVDSPDKRKYWVREENGTYDWKDPPSGCTGSEAVDKFTQYRDTLTQFSTEKLRKIADAMGFYITEYVQEEVRYGYRPNNKVDYEDYYYPFCRSVQGYFAEMPDVTFKLEDTQHETTKYWGKWYEGVNMYVLTNNGFKKCFTGAAFFGNYYDANNSMEWRPYRDTCFKTSFFKIVDIAGGVHILPTNNTPSVRNQCHIVNLFDTTTHDWVDYGVTMSGYLRPVSDSDTELEGSRRTMISRGTSYVGTQKFITKMKDNEAWYRNVVGADTTYLVGTGVKLDTPKGNPANATIIGRYYHITTLSNGIKIFSSGSRDPIAFKD